MAKGMRRRPKVDLDSGVEDVTLLVLEWLGEQGVGAMIQVDAERMRDGQPAWTFAASGGPLAAAHPRPGSPGFRNLRPNLPCPARAPKPTRPGPGRPLGSKNRHPATRYGVSKTARRPETIAERNQLRR